MIGLLITLIIVCIVFGALYYVISLLPLPAPFGTIALVLLLLVLLLLLSYLLPLGAIHPLLR